VHHVPTQTTHKTKSYARRFHVLRIEHLETRELLTGVVDIQIFPGNPVGSVAAGVMNLVGDGSNNGIDINQTSNVGEF